MAHTGEALDSISEMGDSMPNTHSDMLTGSGTVKMTKVVVVDVKGTLNQFSVVGPTAGTWHVVDGKHHSVFGTDESISHMSGGAHMSDLDSSLSPLKNATITKATVLQTYNTFPVPLGVTINVLPSNEVCDTGDKYAFTTIPNTSVNVPIKIYEAGQCQTDAAEWRKNYSRFTPTNLETQDVLKVPNSPYVFVNETHPVINLLRVNRGLLGVDIDTIPKMDEQWYKITHPLMATSCDIIRQKILSRQGLSSLSLSLLPPSIV